MYEIDVNRILYQIDGKTPLWREPPVFDPPEEGDEDQVPVLKKEGVPLRVFDVLIGSSLAPPLPSQMGGRDRTSNENLIRYMLALDVERAKSYEGTTAVISINQRTIKEIEPDLNRMWQTIAAAQVLALLGVEPSYEDQPPTPPAPPEPQHRRQERQGSGLPPHMAPRDPRPERQRR
jgi:hypothetical protein